MRRDARSPRVDHAGIRGRGALLPGLLKSTCACVNLAVLLPAMLDKGVSGGVVEARHGWHGYTDEEDTLQVPDRLRKSPLRVPEEQRTVRCCVRPH